MQVGYEAVWPYRVTWLSFSTSYKLHKLEQGIALLYDVESPDFKRAEYQVLA
jgi:hypothetical protein